MNRENVGGMDWQCSVFVSSFGFPLLLLACLFVFKQATPETIVKLFKCKVAGKLELADALNLHIIIDYSSSWLKENIRIQRNFFICMSLVGYEQTQNKIKEYGCKEW